MKVSRRRFLGAVAALLCLPASPAAAENLWFYEGGFGDPLTLDDWETHGFIRQPDGGTTLVTKGFLHYRERIPIERINEALPPVLKTHRRDFLLVDLSADGRRFFYTAHDTQILGALQDGDDVFYFPLVPMNVETLRS